MPELIYLCEGRCATPKTALFVISTTGTHRTLILVSHAPCADGQNAEYFEKLHADLDRRLGGADGTGGLHAYRDRATVVWLGDFNNAPNLALDTDSGPHPAAPPHVGCAA